MGEEKIVTGNTKVGEKPKMCPTCGANDIMYNPQINRFVCKYCRTEFEIATEKLEGFVIEEPVEVKPVEAPEGTDTELKTELNNAVTEEVKADVVSVPNVRI
jgi:ribosomal protein S27AE